MKLQPNSDKKAIDSALGHIVTVVPALIAELNKQINDKNIKQGEALACSVFFAAAIAKECNITEKLFLAACKDALAASDMWAELTKKTVTEK